MMTVKTEKVERAFPADELVKSLTNVDGEIEKTQVVGGFMGAANEETGKVRFFLDPALASWLDISPKHIIHSLKLKTTQSAIGGTLIWLSMDTPKLERIIVPSGVTLPRGGLNSAVPFPQPMGL